MALPVGVGVQFATWVDVESRTFTEEVHVPKRSNLLQAAPLSDSSPLGESTFEHLTARLGLTPEKYEDSTALKEWVRRNKNERYVPPELLEAWGFTVDA